MVRKHTREMNRIICITAAVVLAVMTGTMQKFASADNNVTFEVNVKELLTVSITTPSAGEWASGNLNSFLRNAVNLSVASNNDIGFTASMTSNSTTTGAPLTNITASSTSTIPTLDGGSTWNRSNTTIAKFWGYSTDDDNETGTYHSVPLKTSTPVALTPANTTGNWSDDVYFGAKADYDTESGTYVGTVIINVVTGTIDPSTNPTVPTNPDTPSDHIPNNNTATYTGTGNRGTGSSGNNGTTVYTTTSSTSSTSTISTTVSEGDTRSSYTNPAGVTKVNEGTPLATGLAATSAVAAATGIVFFIVAKRRKDEEDEEEEY